MSKILHKEKGTIKMQLMRLAIKPVSKDALYEKSVLEAIRNVPGKGRPPKNKAEK
jgi:hypothetical protein